MNNDAVVALTERVRLLEAEREILRTLNSYSHSVDYGLAAAWADCFTEDGVFEAGPTGGERRRIVGREALSQFIAEHSHAPERWHKHVNADPLINIDGECATCTSYFALLYDHEGVAVVRTFGRYQDRLRGSSDGRWRFTERITEVESARRDLPRLRP